MAYSNNGNKSKYLRDPNEKKSKYIRNKDEKKSKYLRDDYYEKEHHYNLTRFIKEEEPEEEGVDVLEELAQTDSKDIKSAKPQIVDSVLDEIAKNDESESFVEGIDSVEKRSAEEIISEAKTAVENLFGSDEDASDNIEKIEEIKSDAPKRDESRTGQKGDSSSLFKHSGLSKDTTVAHKNSREEAKKKLVISMVITMVVMTAISLLVQFVPVSLPFLPTMVNIEFSVFPELIVSIAYGPLFALIIVLVKNILHIIIANNGFVSELSNFVLDGTFVVIVGLFYSKRMYALPSKKSRSNPNKDRRRVRILLGGLIGSVATSVLSFFLTRFVSYPLLIKQYAAHDVNEGNIIFNYQQALDKINMAFPEFISATITKIESLTQAILFFNVPITFAKFIFVTLVSALVYVILSPYLHFRRKSK